MSADTVQQLAEADVRARRTVAALGGAIHAAHVDASPPLARAVQAEQNLYARIEREFGLLTSTQAGERMGSRSAAKRNIALAALRRGRLLGLTLGAYVVFPGFQFDHSGARPVIADLIAVGLEHDRTGTSLVQWLMGPTTYLDGDRPVDILDDPTRLLDAARRSFGVQW